MQANIDTTESMGLKAKRALCALFVLFSCTTKEMQWMNACIKTSIMWHILDINAWNQCVERVVVVIVFCAQTFFFHCWFRCCDISWSSRTATVNRTLSFRRHNSIFIIYIATITDTIRKSTVLCIRMTFEYNEYACRQSLIGSTQHRCELNVPAVQLTQWHKTFGCAWATMPLSLSSLSVAPDYGNYATNLRINY